MSCSCSKLCTIPQCLDSIVIGTIDPVTDCVIEFQEDITGRIIRVEATSDADGLLTADVSDIFEFFSPNLLYKIRVLSGTGADCSEIAFKVGEYYIQCGDLRFTTGQTESATLALYGIPDSNGDSNLTFIAPLDESNGQVTINAYGITAGLFRQSSALSVVGNATNALAAVQDITAGADGDVLYRSGNTLVFGKIPIASITPGGSANQIVSMNLAGDGLEYRSFAIGTSGTDLNIGYTANTITFNAPTASAVNRGLLSTADWTTFNNKQAALGYTPVNKAGDTMLGNLVLNANASVALGAVTLQQLNAAVVGLYQLVGTYDASGNVFPSTGGSGSGGAIEKGDVWIISVAGTLGGTVVEAGDQLVALIDAPGQTVSNWNIQDKNLGYTPISNVLNSGQILVGNASNIASPVSMSGEATISNTGAITLSNSGVIGKVLTGYVSGAGTVSATDTILQGIQKLNGNITAIVSSQWTTSGPNVSYGSGNGASTPHVIINPIDAGTTVSRSDTGLEIQRDGGGVGRSPMLSFFQNEIGIAAGAGAELGAVSYNGRDAGGNIFQAASISVVLNRSVAGGANGILRLSALGDSGGYQGRDISIFGKEGIDIFNTSEAIGAGPGLNVFRINGSFIARVSTITSQDYYFQNNGSTVGATATNLNLVGGNRSLILKAVHSDNIYAEWTSGSSLYLKEGSSFVMTIATGGNVAVGSLTANSKFSVVTNSLGAVQTNTSGLLLENTTAALTGARQQIAPAWRSRGYAWDTTASASRSVDMQWSMEPQEGPSTGNNSYQGFFYLRQSKNGGTYRRIAIITGESQLYLGSTAPLMIGPKDDAGNSMVIDSFQKPLLFDFNSNPGAKLEDIGSSMRQFTIGGSSVGGILCLSNTSSQTFKQQISASGVTSWTLTWPSAVPGGNGYLLASTTGGVSSWFNIFGTANTYTAKQIYAAPVLGAASITLPHGTTPTTLADGDMWTDTLGAYIRINGVTKTFTLL